MTRLASRTSRLRQIEQMLLMSPKGMRVVELVDRLEVDRRTVYRDLDFLGEQGVPVWQQNGRFGINRTRYLATVRLSFHEAMALVLAGLLLSRTLDEHNPHVATALRKLAVTLPNPLTSQLERAAKRVQKHGDGQQQVAVLEGIAEGWANTLKVKAGYRSPKSGELRERLLSPYALEPTPSGTYVICHDDWADDIRTFKLSRLEYAEVTNDPFAIPADFDPEAYLSSGWRIMSGDGMMEVVLRFTAAVTPHVKERKWHATQKLEMMEDGGCLLRVEIAEPLEMQPWIRSWGAQVEVLSPVWLRDQIAEDLLLAVEQYKNSLDD